VPPILYRCLHHRIPLHFWHCTELLEELQSYAHMRAAQIGSLVALHSLVVDLSLLEGFPHCRGFERGQDGGHQGSVDFPEVGCILQAQLGHCLEEIFWRCLLVSSSSSSSIAPPPPSSSPSSPASPWGLVNSCCGWRSGWGVLRRVPCSPLSF
jgi:hypothetical protein